MTIRSDTRLQIWRSSIEPAALLVIGLLGMASVVNVYRMPSGSAKLLHLVASLVLGASLIVAAIRALTLLRAAWRRSVALIAACIAIVIAWQFAPGLGLLLRDRLFFTQLATLDQSALLYASMPRGESRERPLDSLPPELKSIVTRVLVFDGGEARRAVWFFYGSQHPSAHRAWIFDSDSAAVVSTGPDYFWHRARRLAPHWHDASD